MRGLAQRASITPPTLYSLIGGKDQIIAELVRDTLDMLDLRLHANSAERGIERAVAIITRSVEMFCESPQVYRSLLKAADHLEANGIRDVLQMKSTARLQADAYRKAIADGDVMGALDPDAFGRSMVFAYRAAFREWAADRLSPSGFEAQILYILYAQLKGDAAPDRQREIADGLARAQKIWLDDLRMREMTDGQDNAASD